MNHDIHETVLLREAVEALGLDSGDKVVDATLGNGGHAKLICEHIGPSGMLLGIDLDIQAHEKAQEALSGQASRIELVVDSFANIKQIALEKELSEVDAILADLGLRTEHLSSSGKGFSFRNEDEPLLMTFGSPKDSLTALDIVNTWSVTDLEKIFKEHSDEQFANPIATEIVRARSKAMIETVGDLVGVIESSVPHWYKARRTHPATKVFQALRMSVNHELDALSNLLQDGFDLLKHGGRMAIISFHSVEDRFVKQTFARLQKSGRAQLVTRKPITPSYMQIKANRRARSSKLRVLEKL